MGFLVILFTGFLPLRGVKMNKKDNNHKTPIS